MSIHIHVYDNKRRRMRDCNCGKGQLSRDAVRERPEDMTLAELKQTLESMMNQEYPTPAELEYIRQLKAAITRQRLGGWRSR